MAPRNRRTEADYHAAAAKRGGQWLGPMPQTTHHKSTWRCAEGHTWEAQLKNIEAGRWCPTCSAKYKIQTNTRKTPDNYQAAAAKHGFVWVGPEVRNAATNPQWQCFEGHTWWATYMAIANVGSGCPYCAGIISLLPKQFQEIALAHGIEWLGPAVTYREACEWRCPKGHTWWAHYGSIRQGKGCPQCWAERRKRS